MKYILNTRRIYTVLIYKVFRILCIVFLIVLGGCGSALDGTKPAFRMTGMAELSTEDDAKKQGIEHFAAGAYGLAMKFFRLVVGLNPVSIEALNGLAASYDQMGQYDLAERYYREALDLDPQSPQTLNNIGFSYYLQGKFDLALAYLSDAFAVGRDDSVVLANRRLATVGQASIVGPGEPGEDDVKPPPVAAREPDRTAAARPAIRIERTAPDVQTLVTRPRPVLVSMTATAVDSAAAPVSEFRAWPVAVEVSNGTGRSRMASRMGRYLAARGVRPARLSNARSYSISRTTIFYRDGWSDHAGAIAELLPVQVGLRREVGQRAAIRVELGADLLDFDVQLIESTRSVSADESI